MKDTICVLGCDGYIGNALVQRLLNKGYKVIGVDNGLRRQAVSEMNSVSAVPILSIDQKIDLFKKMGDFTFYNCDVAFNSNLLKFIIDKERPKTVVNLAHLPSGPYSLKGWREARDTIFNNILPTNDLLWFIKEIDDSIHYITIGSTGEYDHYSNIDIEEGYIVIEHNGRKSNEMIYPRRPTSLYHACYDDQTEVLTSDGWKRFENLTQDDEVATLDKENDRLVYQKPLELFEYDYDGDLISIKNKLSDLLVTPNHKIFHHSHWKTPLERWKLTEAEDLFDKGVCLRRNVGNWEGDYDTTYWTIPSCYAKVGNEYSTPKFLPEMQIPIDDWIDFFGWWITEGGLYKHVVSISQQKKYNFNDIIRSLQHFDRAVQTQTRKIDEDTNKVNGFFINSVQLSTYLKNFGLSNAKFIPKAMKNLPKDKLKRLLMVMLRGDGYINDKSKKLQAHYYTKSKQLADDVQEIAFKCGYATVLKKESRSENEYVVHISENATTQIIMSNSVKDHRSQKAYERIPYKGKVYCCEVPNGIIYVRRNGRPVWSGNSKVASTYIIDYLTRLWKLRATDIQQSVVFGMYTDDIDQSKVYSRLDSDDAFSTCINKFTVQAKIEAPLTVYGEGKHQRGFLSLNDSIQALMIAIENIPDPGRVRVWNQLSEWCSINHIAELVKKIGSKKGLNVEIEHIPSPRNEYTGEHYYHYKTDILKSLGYKPTRTMEQEIEYTMDLIDTSLSDKLRKVVYPTIQFTKG